MIGKYTVKKGDTLNRIAVDHGVTADAIAKLNGIGNRNLIRVDQVLQIPDQLFHVEPVTPPETDLSSLLVIEFRDCANQPIEGLDVCVSVAGKTETHKTDAKGQVPVVQGDQRQVAKIEVKKPSGALKKIAEVPLNQPAVHARIVSPKVKAPSEMKVHEGPSQTARTTPPEPKPAGTVTLARSENGNPVQSVSLECPNPENLRLGPNAKYRDVIISAGKRSGFSPQSIAAIMNAEAATITIVTHVPVLDKKTRKPAIGKDGKPKTKPLSNNTGEWDPRSASPKSSARGMTQFLDASWIDMALAEGTFLNARAKKEGWLTTTTIAIKKKKKTIEQELPAFKLANGHFVTKSKERSLVQVLSSRPYVTARATASDANLQKLLDLRYEAEYAINTAVDYGIQNLKGLQDADFKVSGVSDGDKAKLIYLTHHLGLADAKKFIKNTMGADNAKTLLIAQVGEDRAAQYAEDNGNDYVRGHRAWLLNFVDRKIDLPAKMCDPSKATGVRDLLAITIAIR